MEDEPQFNVLGGIDRQLLVESGGALVILDQQPFVDPIENEIEDEGERVQDWKACGIGEYAE